MSLIPAIDAESVKEREAAMVSHQPFRHYYLPRLRGERGFAPGSSSVYELQSLQFCDREMTDEDCETIAEALVESFEHFGPLRCSSSALRIISVASNKLISNRGVRAILKALRSLDGPAISSLHTLDFSDIGESLSDTTITEIVDLVRCGPSLRIVRFTGAEAVTAETVLCSNWRTKGTYVAADVAGNTLLNLVPSPAKAAILAAANCDSSVHSVNLSLPVEQDDLDRQFPTTYECPTTVKLLTVAMAHCNSITVLDFSSNNIGDAKTAILAEILKTNKTLLELKLRNNEITTPGALSLFHALRDGPNQTLLELDLTNNGVTDVAAKVLLDVVTSDVTGLGIVRLEQNCTSPKMISAVFRALCINTQHPAVKKLIPKLAANDSRTTRIGLGEDDINVDDTAVKVVLQAMRNNTNVTSLDFSNSRVTDEGAFYIAEMIEALPKLRKVVCKFAHIGEEGARRIMRAIPKCKSTQVELVDLKFQTPPLDSYLMRLLEKIAGLSAMPTVLKDIGLPLSENNADITSVDLSAKNVDMFFSDNSIATLGVLLEQNTVVDHITLAYNGRVSVLSVPILSSMAVRLRELDLSGNNFRDIELITLVDALVNPQCRLETLRLADNLLTNEFSHKVSMALRNHNDRMTFCDVSKNRLVLPVDAAEVKYYCDLNTHTLAFKSLMRTLQDDVIASLKEVNLCVIDSSVPGGTSNAFKREFTDLSVELLFGALKCNRTVQLVNLSGNKVTSVGAKTIADYLLENTSLTHLDLSFNYIADDGFAAITQSLRSNGTLKALVFNNNPIKDSDTVKKLIHALQQSNSAVGTAYSTAHNMRAKQQREQGFISLEDERVVDKMLDNAIFDDAMKDLKMLERVRGSV